MDETIYQGVITFINHEKQYATIDYKKDDKKKTITCKVGAMEQLKSEANKHAKKLHHFRVGDEVNFEIKLTDRGDKMTAYNVRFLYNTALELLLNKAAVENRFLGFLKLADDQFFVKELDSYIFFPLTLSKWEKEPDEKLFNEAVDFKLINLDKPKNLSAELFAHEYIPEYKSAQHYYKNKIPVEATVFKVTPFAAYVNVIGNKVQAKIDLPAEGKEELKEGSVIKVLINYLSNKKIAVERVDGLLS
ncbi:MAG: hypothetical protein V4722_08720 [Bacteroidota bacterium]